MIMIPMRMILMYKNIFSLILNKNNKIIFVCFLLSFGPGLGLPSCKKIKCGPSDLVLDLNKGLLVQCFRKHQNLISRPKPTQSECVLIMLCSTM